MNILVVDDEDKICSIFTKFLSIEGHRVKSALNGNEAVELAKKEYFDVVFLDIIMPGILGVDVIDKIKESSPNTKVVMITGKLVNKDLINELKQKGASAILQKPFKIKDMFDTISESCDSAIP